MGGGPPCFLQGSTCLTVLWYRLVRYHLRVRGFHPLWQAFPKPFCFAISELLTARNPVMPGITVWALPCSLAATWGIDLSFFSSRYLDVSVPGLAFHTLWIRVWMYGVLPYGLPHSDVRGSRDMCSSPRLFAAYHVFHRLSVPRHPPCALPRLTFSSLPFPFRKRRSSHDASLA